MPETDGNERYNAAIGLMGVLRGEISMKRSLSTCLLAMLLTLTVAATAKEPQRLLILTQGPDGHPRQTHEYVAGGEVLNKLFAAVPDLRVETIRVDQSEEPAVLKAILTADGIMLSVAEGAKWLASEPRRGEAFARHAAQKRGLFVLHWAMGTKSAEPVEPFVKLFGACHGGADRKYRVLEANAIPREHAATKELKPFKIKDEFYFALKTNSQTPPEPLLEIEIDGGRQMVAWAWERPGGGRSAGFSGGHFHANWERAEYQRLIGQTILWTVGLTAPADFPPRLAIEDLKLP